MWVRYWKIFVEKFLFKYDSNVEVVEFGFEEMRVEVFWFDDCLCVYVSDGFCEWLFLGMFCMECCGRRVREFCLFWWICLNIVDVVFKFYELNDVSRFCFKIYLVKFWVDVVDFYDLVFYVVIVIVLDVNFFILGCNMVKSFIFGIVIICVLML